jgi:hypothetical protein
MTKRVLIAFCALSLVLCSSLASAATVSRDQLPRHIQAVAGSYGLWFPSAIDWSSTNTNWTWILVISNFYGEQISVSVSATAYSIDPSNQPTEKVSLIGPYQKIFLSPSDFGFFNTVADLWITSNDSDIVGATLYLLDADTGRLITTVPHIDIQYE